MYTELLFCIHRDPHLSTHRCTHTFGFLYSTPRSTYITHADVSLKRFCKASWLPLKFKHGGLVFGDLPRGTCCISPPSSIPQVFMPNYQLEAVGFPAGSPQLSGTMFRNPFLLPMQSRPSIPCTLRHSGTSTLLLASHICLSS